MLDNDKSLKRLILEVKQSLQRPAVGKTHLGRIALPAAECGGPVTPVSKEVTL